MRAARTAAEPFRESDFAEEDRGYRIDGQPSPCRIWQRGLTAGGYSSLRVEGVTAYGHRVAAALASGAIPQGMDIGHRCAQRDCCHPDHLEIVLPADNVRDGKLAKLTREQVEEIKHRTGEGETRAALAREFGVAPGTVSSLLHPRPPKLRRARVVLTEEQVLDIWNSRREGETLRSIGERNGIHPNYVIAVVQRAPSRQQLRDAAREVLRALSESWESLDAPWPVDRIDAARALGPDGPLDARQRVLAFRVLVEGRSLRVAGAEYGLKASSAARLLYDAAGLVAEYLWPRHWRAAR